MAVEDLLEIYAASGDLDKLTPLLDVLKYVGIPVDAEEYIRKARLQRDLIEKTEEERTKQTMEEEKKREIENLKADLYMSAIVGLHHAYERALSEIREKDVDYRVSEKEIRRGIATAYRRLDEAIKETNVDDMEEAIEDVKFFSELINVSVDLPTVKIKQSYLNAFEREVGNIKKHLKRNPYFTEILKYGKEILVNYGRKAGLEEKEIKEVLKEIVE